MDPQETFWPSAGFPGNPHPKACLRMLHSPSVTPDSIPLLLARFFLPVYSTVTSSCLSATSLALGLL